MEQNEAPSRSIGNDHGYRNVLLARFSALGDVAMTIPVVYSACMCYPDVRFILVTRPSMVGIFINAPANLTLVGADVKNEYAGVSGIRRLCKRLADDYDIDAFIDLHDVLRTQIMRLFMRLRGIKSWALNKGRRHRRALTRPRNKVMLPLLSMRARHREAFFKAGLPVEMRFKGLFHSGKADNAAFANIPETQNRAAGEKWIGIAPFAAHPGKVYPIDKMTEVVKDLDQRGDCRIFIFGAGDDESRIANQWAQQFKHVVPLAGKKYGFKAELSLLNHLDLMITMDSANMHLASIAGTRTLSIWGATHHYCGFKGWHQRDDDMVQLPLSCRPCSVFGDKACFRHDMLCLNAIRPEGIIKKINSIIGTAADQHHQ